MGEKHLLVNQRSAQWLVVLRPHVLLRNVIIYLFIFLWGQFCGSQKWRSSSIGRFCQLWLQAK